MAWYCFTKEEMEKNPPREIHTGLYGQKALQIISSVMGQLSDGMWENSRRMEWAWQFATYNYKKDGLADDEEVIIKIASVYAIPEYEQRFDHWTKQTYNRYVGQFHNRYAGMNDQKIRNFFATKIYQVFREEAKELKRRGLELKWNKNNEEELDYMDGTVAEAWNAVNTLRKFEKAVPAA